MGQFHGTIAELWIDDDANTCHQFDTDLNNITFTRSKNNPEVTTFGDNTVNRLDGLRDVVLDCTGVFNSGASTVVGTLDALFTNSVVSRVQYYPGGNVSGEALYQACMLLNSYAVNEPLDGVVTINFSMAIGTGSLTATCVS